MKRPLVFWIFLLVQVSGLFFLTACKKNEPGSVENGCNDLYGDPVFFATEYPQIFKLDFDNNDPSRIVFIYSTADEEKIVLLDAESGVLTSVYESDLRIGNLRIYEDRLLFSLVGGDVHIFDMGNNSLMQITNNPGCHYHVAWGPQGQSVYVSHSLCSEIGILQLDLEGNEISQYENGLASSYRLRNDSLLLGTSGAALGYLNLYTGEYNHFLGSFDDFGDGTCDWINDHQVLRAGTQGVFIFNSISSSQTKIRDACPTELVYWVRKVPDENFAYAHKIDFWQTENGSVLHSKFSFGKLNLSTGSFLEIPLELSE